MIGKQKKMIHPKVDHFTRKINLNVNKMISIMKRNLLKFFPVFSW